MVCTFHTRELTRKEFFNKAPMIIHEIKRPYVREKVESYMPSLFRLYRQGHTHLRKRPYRIKDIIYMKKIAKTIGIIALALSAALSPVYADSENKGKDHKTEAHAVGSTLEVHINDSGKVLVRGAKVTAVSGNSISADTTFGGSTLSWVVDATETQKVVRRYGGSSSIAEIQIGDFISFTGNLTGTGTTWNVKATSLKDWSIQVKNSSFSGTVASITNSSFVLTTENGKSITVNTDSNTKITKGDETVAFSTITVGAKISKTEGLFNNNLNTLQAKSIKLYKDPILNKRTFEGKISSTTSVLPPTTFDFSSEGKVYKVIVPAGISILNKDWVQIPLTSFQANDSVRVYGAIQAANTDTIDATVVRNTSR